MLKDQSGFADVNGLKLYYSVHGEGSFHSQPLVLLHGSLGSSEMFDAILPTLTRGRVVITTDMQAHGRTADIDRPLQLEHLAADVAALVAFLGFDCADIMGYSLGGAVALQTAFYHPECVNKLIVVSFPYQRAGWYPEFLAGAPTPDVADAMRETPMYRDYVRLAPNPEHWPVLLAKISEGIKADYDWTEEVRSIKVPTLLAFGDADAVRTSHTVEFFELLGGGQRDGGWDGSGTANANLAILPGLTHYDIFADPALAYTVTHFLER